MSKMKDLLLELDADFERLTETSMEWRKSTWAKQIKDGRFETADQAIDFTHTHIYWFESYASVILAKTILTTLGEDYLVMFDDAMGQYAMTTTYATIGWRD